MFSQIRWRNAYIYWRNGIVELSNFGKYKILLWSLRHKFVLAQSRYKYVNVRNIGKYAANNLMYFMFLFLGLHSGTIIFMPLDAKHNVVSIGYVNLCFGSFKYYTRVSNLIYLVASRIFSFRPGKWNAYDR